MKNYTITVNGTPYNVTVEEGAGAPVAAAPVAAPAAAPAPAPAAAPAPATQGTAGSVKVEAPMPGTILDVKVSVGDSVSSGSVLCILEAMKMENEIVAPKDATVTGINVSKGESVDSGTVMLTLA